MTYAFNSQVQSYGSAANLITLPSITPAANGDLLAFVLAGTAAGQIGGWNVSDSANNVYTPTVVSFSGTIIGITFAAPPSGISAPLNAPFAGTTGAYMIQFSDGELRAATLTNGSTACSWLATVRTFSGPLLGTPTTTGMAYIGVSYLLIAMYAQNVSAVPTVISVTQSTGTNLYGAYAADYSGISALGAYLGGSGSYTAARPIGPDNINSGNVSGVNVPSMGFGFCWNVSAQAVPTAGTTPTAYTGRGGVWETGSSIAEDALIASNVPATFGVVSGNQYDTFATVGMAFALSVPTSYSLESSEYF
jgi:hypothetical protein